MHRLQEVRPCCRREGVAPLDNQLHAAVQGRQHALQEEGCRAQNDCQGGLDTGGGHPKQAAGPAAAGGGGTKAPAVEMHLLHACTSCRCKCCRYHCECRCR